MTAPNDPLAELQTTLCETLGAPGRVDAAGLPAEGVRGDPVAVAALLLAIPPALLAAHDIAQRMKLGEAVQRLKSRLQGKGARLRLGSAVVDLDHVDAPSVLAAASAADNGEPVWDVFVSYARPDHATVDRIYDALSPKLSVFVAHQSIGPGEHWPGAIWNAQRTARATLAVVSPHWSGAWYQQDELIKGIALKRRHGHALLPLYLHGIPEAFETPPGLTLLQGVGVPECGGLDGALVVVGEALLRLRDG